MTPITWECQPMPTGGVTITATYRTATHRASISRYHGTHELTQSRMTQCMLLAHDVAHMTAALEKAGFHMDTMAPENALTGDITLPGV